LERVCLSRTRLESRHNLPRHDNSGYPASVVKNDAKNNCLLGRFVGERSRLVGQFIVGERSRLVGQFIVGERSRLVGQLVVGERSRLVGQLVVGERSPLVGQFVVGERSSLVGQLVVGETSPLVGQFFVGERLEEASLNEIDQSLGFYIDRLSVSWAAGPF
jgi:hypothetical protein